MGLEYDSTEWGHFIYSSLRSLKAILLRNRNIFSFIPISYLVEMKET